MSKSHRRTTARKLQEIISTATDPATIIEAANTLAKYLPKPKQRNRKTGTPVAKKEESTLEQMVEAMEKARKGQSLSAEELKMVAAVERQRKAADSLNGGSQDVA